MAEQVTERRVDIICNRCKSAIDPDAWSRQERGGETLTIHREVSVTQKRFIRWTSISRGVDHRPKVYESRIDLCVDCWPRFMDLIHGKAVAEVAR